MPALPKCSLLPIVVAVCLPGGPLLGNVSAVVPELGDLENWGAYSIGTGAGRDYLSGFIQIQGDVGVAGNGKLTMDVNSLVQNDLYYRSNGVLTLQGMASIAGTVFNNQNAELDNTVNEAMAASDAAFALAATLPGTNINLSGNQNRTITGAPGDTVILSLKNFTLKGNATLTLEGTTATTFVINVSRKFSLANASQIILSGGLRWDDVVFNVHGAGSNVSVSGSAVFNGILLAPNRKAKFSGTSKITGTVITNQFSFTDLSRLAHPPVISP